MPSAAYDLVLVGSSFASSFFLHEALEHAGPGFRVLVLERGFRHEHSWRLRSETFALPRDPHFDDRGPVSKPWISHITFGGNSNCWWACAPRFLPEDFETSTRFGVGVDWPLSYGDLEPHYARAEEIMAVSGEPLPAMPRSTPFPQPPHRFNDPDRLLRRRFPGLFVAQPCSRTRVRTANRRRCCASGTCSLCPRDAKFTVQNELEHLYDDPRVELRLGADVERIEIDRDVAGDVVFRLPDGRRRRVRGEVVGLGASALFNPVILQRSGLDSRWTGAGLHEQKAIDVDVLLDGVDNFQGSTSITGHGYMLAQREPRNGRNAALMEHFNVPRLRPERGRHRQRMRLKFIFEDRPQERNRVTWSGEGIEVDYHGVDSSCRRAIDDLDDDLQPILAALPVERYEIAPLEESRSEAHILGTTRLGTDPATSVVDPDLVHHRVRNLLVLGSGTFPAGGPANPTLTLCALSLRSARRLYGAAS